MRKRLGMNVRKNFAKIWTTHCLQKKHFSQPEITLRLLRCLWSDACKDFGSQNKNVVNRCSFSKQKINSSPKESNPFLQTGASKGWIPSNRSDEPTEALKGMTKKIVESEIFYRMMNTKHRLIRNGEAVGTNNKDLLLSCNWSRFFTSFNFFFVRKQSSFSPFIILRRRTVNKRY